MKRTIAALILTVMMAAVAVGQDAPPPPDRERGRERGMFRGPEGEHGRGMRIPPPGMPGMGAWWKNSDIAKELNLTDAQRQQLEKTFLDYRMKLVDLNADVERQELKLEPLLDADSLDENAISSQLDQVIAARGRLEKSNAMMGVSMRKVLTQVQWKKLQSMHRERMPMPPGAPGMHMRGVPPQGVTPPPAGADAPKPPKNPA